MPRGQGPFPGARASWDPRGLGLPPRGASPVPPSRGPAAGPGSSGHRGLGPRALPFIQGPSPGARASRGLGCYLAKPRPREWSWDNYWKRRLC